jgi:hypothetical protein
MNLYVIYHIVIKTKFVLGTDRADYCGFSWYVLHSSLKET